MFSRAEDLRSFDSIPLSNAVLCVDCECVTSSRLDNCPVCGSYSVFHIAPALGGTRLISDDEGQRSPTGPRFDLDISIVLKEIDAKGMNTAVDGIADVLRSRLAGDGSSFHVDVSPAGEMLPMTGEGKKITAKPASGLADVPAA